MQQYQSNGHTTQIAKVASQLTVLHNTTLQYRKKGRIRSSAAFSIIALRLVYLSDTFTIPTRHVEIEAGVG